jgi:hypothetical protein
MRNYLVHHGIKGQKWGVRRFQNADGSYTNLGKQRRQQTNVFYKGQKARLNDEHKHEKDMSWLGDRKDVMKNYHPVKDDLIFKKGSEFERITSSKTENPNKRRYVTQTIENYNNDHFNFDEQGNSLKTYIKTYTIDRDIKIAGYNTVNKVLKDIGEIPLETINIYGQNGQADYFMNRTDKDKKISKAITDYLKKNNYDGLIDPVDISGFSNSSYIIINDVLKEIGMRES